MRGLEGYDHIAVAQMHVLRNLALEGGIRRDFFGRPDHFSIRTTGFDDFSELLIDVEADADRVATAEKDQRQIAIAQLSGHAILKAVGIGYVEIVEPQPESEIQVDMFKSNGLGYYVDETGPILSALTAAGLKPTRLYRPVPMVAAALGETGAAGHIRFVRVPMAQFMKEQIRTGEFKELELDKQ